MRLHESLTVSIVLGLVVQIGCDCERSVSIATSGESKDSRNEAQEIERIAAKLNDPRFEGPLNNMLLGLALMPPEYASRAHDAVGKNTGLTIDMPWEQFSIRKAIAQAGGLNEYRRRIVSMLHHDSVYVRCFGAFWLAMVGGRENVRDLVELLHAKGLPVEREDDKESDVAGAVLGLGIIGAREHAEEIASLLGSANSQIRTSAVASLGYMKAVEYAPRIALLLSDGDEGTVSSAILCLIELEARQYVHAIVKTIRQDVYCPNEVLCAGLRALLAFEAREEAQGMANLLFERYPFVAPSVAALLGWKNEVERIVALLDVENWATRAAAVTALGVLGADEYAGRIAESLNDKQGYVRDFAAWALVLLESREYGGAAIALIDADQDKTPVLAINDSIMGPAKREELKTRALTSLARLREQLGMLQKPR